MTEFQPGKADLHAIVLNDVGNCAKDILSGSDFLESWGELNSAIETANLIGIPQELVLSKLLNSLPEPLRTSIIADTANKLNIPEKDIWKMIAPGD